MLKSLPVQVQGGEWAGVPTSWFPPPHGKAGRWTGQVHLLPISREVPTPGVAWEMLQVEGLKTFKSKMARNSESGAGGKKQSERERQRMRKNIERKLQRIFSELIRELTPAWGGGYANEKNLTGTKAVDSTCSHQPDLKTPPLTAHGAEGHRSSSQLY